jgi:large subunit ribosomal protein L19
MDISVFQTKPKNTWPDVRTGQTVKVSFKIKEGERERIQLFQGLVVKLKRGGAGGSFTVRKISNGIGVEHTFPFSSPLLEKIDIVRHGKVRRAKLYYIRALSTKEARLKERREKVAEKETATAPVAEQAPVEQPQ